MNEKMFKEINSANENFTADFIQYYIDGNNNIHERIKRNSTASTNWKYYKYDPVLNEDISWETRIIDFEEFKKIVDKEDLALARIDEMSLEEIFEEPLQYIVTEKISIKDMIKRRNDPTATYMGVFMKVYYSDLLNIYVGKQISGVPLLGALLVLAGFIALFMLLLRL